MGRRTASETDRWDYEQDNDDLKMNDGKDGRIRVRVDRIRARDRISEEGWERICIPRQVSRR